MLALLFVAMLEFFVAAPGVAGENAVARGEYLVRAGGCFSCHTAKGGPELAGGRAPATPFGTFYSPNNTPDRETRVGRWTDAQFLRALHEGVRPDGSSYFPVFPYPSFTGISDRDALAIKAYLFSRPPVRQPNRPHNVAFPVLLAPVADRLEVAVFHAGTVPAGAAAQRRLHRGAYLVTALGHCGECHTPRNLLGATRPSLRLAGTEDGPDGQAVPNITPDRRTGIGAWDKSDIAGC